MNNKYIKLNCYSIFLNIVMSQMYNSCVLSGILSFPWVNVSI